MNAYPTPAPASETLPDMGVYGNTSLVIQWDPQAAWLEVQVMRGEARVTWALCEIGDSPEQDGITPVVMFEPLTLSTPYLDLTAFEMRTLLTALYPTPEAARLFEMVREYETPEQRGYGDEDSLEFVGLSLERIEDELWAELNPPSGYAPSRYSWVH